MIHTDTPLPVEKEKKPPKPRKPYTQPERELRLELLILLRKLKQQGKIKFRRIEPWGQGEWDVPDIWIFSYITKWAGWIELKSLDGIIRPGQQKWADDCKEMNVNHIFARSTQDVARVIL